MAAAISAYNNIEIKKSLFSTKAIYTPTQSAVKVNVLEYVPAEGERIERLLNMPVSKMGDELDQKGKPKTVGMGHYRLELCLSTDQQFCALQLFRFTDFQNQPVTEPRFYEGSEAATFAKLL